MNKPFKSFLPTKYLLTAFINAYINYIKNSPNGSRSINPYADYKYNYYYYCPNYYYPNYYCYY